MRPLVTGGLGVNGAWVTRKLVGLGIRPVVIDLRRDFSLIGPSVAEAIEFVQGDVGDTALVGAILASRGIDSIVHMAALTGHGAVDPDPKRTFDLNAYAAVGLLEAARLAGVRRFVFTSSRAVYGEITGRHAAPHYAPIAEDHPLRPRTLYDVCKVTSEGVGRAFAASFGMSFVSLRFATIFGPGKTLRHKGFGVVSRIIENPLAGQPVHIARGGDQKDDFIYAEDAAQGVVDALLADAPRHAEYNISTGRLHTLGDVAAAVRRRLPDADIRIGPGLNIFGEGPNYSGLLDPSRAEADLGFRADADMQSLVDRYIRAMRDLGLAPPAA